MPARLMICLLSALTLTFLTACNKVKISDDDITLYSEKQMVAAIEDPQTLILDVRRPEAYAAGHIPNAVNIQLPDIRRSDPRLTVAEVLVVYSGGYTDPLGIAAAKRLRANGYDTVYEYKGGIEEWTRAGRRLVQSQSPSAVRPDSG